MRKLLKFKTILIIIVIPMIFFGGVYFGIKLYRDHDVNSFKKFICNIDTYASRYIAGSTTTPDLIEILITEKEYYKLNANRNNAVKAGVILNEHKKYVTAKIIHHNKIVDTEIRLKGDNVDHLETNKWSFRVKLGADKTILGMRKFSLQNPKSRNFIKEWLYHKILKTENIIALRYKFVNLKINNQNRGVYALEEHFDKLLIENNNRREGPIVKFNEDLYWDDFYNPWSIQNKSLHDERSFNCSNIEVFQKNKTLKNKNLRDQFNIANSLLYNFKIGKLKTSETFDTKKLATFFSLNDLLGAQHANRWHNLRFYYNPISSKLEPIGFDADCGGQIKELNIVSNDPFCKLIFKDTIFIKEYYKELHRISNCDFMKNIFDSLGVEFAKNCNILHKEFFYYEFDNMESIINNQNFIQKEINQKNKISSHLITFTDEKIIFELKNEAQFPVEINNIVYKNNYLMQKPMIIPGSSDTINYNLLSLNLPDSIDYNKIKPNKFKVLYKIIGSNNIEKIKVYGYPKEKHDFILNDFMNSKINLTKVPFIDIDESNKIIKFKLGEHIISQDVIIPAGYKVIGKGNTKLLLKDSAKIISYSPFNIEGDENEKFKIIGEDSTAQGLCILQTDIESTFKNVLFKNLSNPNNNNWSLTGAVNFFETKVKLSHCSFIGINCEDALNIISSTFSIKKCLFNDIYSDAFDSDFSNGSIYNSSFINVGNDGIDVSGSNIVIENITFKYINDKSISIGENSRASAKKINISNSNYGVVCKDLSQLKIENSNINNVNMGFIAFQKKPEFGPARIIANNVLVSKTNKPFNIEINSELIFDGEMKRDFIKDIKNLLYK